jgi:hypothetical protein
MLRRIFGLPGCTSAFAFSSRGNGSFGPACEGVAGTGFQVLDEAIVVAEGRGADLEEGL